MALRAPLMASGVHGTPLMHTPPMLHSIAASASSHAPFFCFMPLPPLQKCAASLLQSGRLCRIIKR